MPAILAVTILGALIFVCVHYATPVSAQATGTEQPGFLRSENNLARTGLADDSSTQQQTVFAGKQEALGTSATRGALQVRADAQSVDDASSPTGESLGFYWGLPKDQGKAGATLQHLQKLSEEKARSSGGQSGFYFSQDIPQQLKASAEQQKPGTEHQQQQQPQGAAQQQGLGLGQTQGQQSAGDTGDGKRAHRKELPQADAAGSARGTGKAGAEERNPLGFYFDGRLEGKGIKEGADPKKDPPESPLKYYFTNQIPDEVKAKLALEAAMRAKQQQAGGA